MDELQQKVALSCRIIAMMGLVGETNGHVSVRSSDDAGMYIRCRSPAEKGLIFTDPEAVQWIDFDGGNDRLDAEYIVPNEYPIHGEIYKRRPEVGCVIHAHPPAAVLCTITGIRLRPIVGAYDPQAMSLTLDGGVPLFEMSKTLTTKEIVAAMLECMGDKDVCLLKSHGIVVTGKTVEDATVRAIKVEHLAQMSLDAARTGRETSEISADDIEYFRSMFRTNERKIGTSYTKGAWVWSHYVKLLEFKGLGLR